MAMATANEDEEHQLWPGEGGEEPETESKKDEDGFEDSALDYQWPVYSFDRPPRRLYHFCHQFRSTGAGSVAGRNGGSESNNFLKGVKWSPDGSCLLSCSDDNTLRLFYMPEDVATACAECSDTDINYDSYGSSTIASEAETVYDFCWYPYMTTTDPATCVFASTTRDHPIHLWDANTGQLRCTYRAYNPMDEITAALSVSFNSSGSKLFAGYDKVLRVFDVHRPGRTYKEHSFLKGAGTSGIVSSIAFSSAYNGMLAIGSYSQTTALYSEDNMELLYVLHGQVGGVTQVLFSKDGNYLYTGGRKDPYILCWDIRNTVEIVYQLYRSTDHTNQRISFDIEPCGRHLGTGGEDGLVHIYDLQSGEWKASFQAASDTVNSFSFHPSLPLAASSSGNRRFYLPDNCDENSSLSGKENCASVWSFCPLEASDCANTMEVAPDDGAGAGENI